MKRIIFYMILIVGMAFSLGFAQDYGNNYNNDGYYNDNGGNVSVAFYSALAPYGNWIQLDNGITVWRPLNMHYGWLPYRYGHWVWTDDGWYWDSYEPFGYIVYHYGRWYYDNYYGWIWVPDNQWAPAWVQWRYDNDYIGWAPLPPYASFSIGFGINFSFNYVTPYNYWHFVGYRYFCDSHPYDHFIHDRYKYRIYSDSRFRTNYGYSDGRVINRGVDVDYIRQRSGGRIVESRIERVDSPRNLSSGAGRNPGVVRAFIPVRDELTRTVGRDANIRRGLRSSSLDVSRVQLFRSPAGRNVTPRQPDIRQENRNSNPWQPQNNRPDNRIINPRQPENVRPQNRNVNPWAPNNVRPENRNQNPRQINKPENHNSNPWTPKSYAPQQRNERPQPRVSRPEIRREPVRQAPQIRRENNNQNRGNAGRVERGRGR